MSSDTDLFGFDQDGICAGYSPGPTGCPFGPTGYEGPGTSFSNISANSSGGTVNFTGGLAPGATAYFSLEEALTATTVFTGGPTVGEQGNAPNPSEHVTTCFAKLPVNCATGDFIHQFTDVNVPGRGPALSLQRTYSSSAAAVDGPFGFGWQSSYNLSMSTDANGFVTIAQENGSTVTFNPNGSGGFVAPPRVLASLVDNGDGTFTFTRRPNQEKFVFSTSGQLDSETDLNGNSTILTYTNNQLTTVTDPAGRTLTFGYAGNHIHQVTDPLGRSTVYAYNAAGNLVKASDPAGRSWSFGYDTGHLLTSMTDPRGGVVTNVYDASARVVKQTDAAKLSTTWTYVGDPTSSTGGVTTMTDQHGNKTVYSYANLELGSVTHGAGTTVSATTSYTYDAATLGQATVTDPRGNVTTNTYDGDGNLLSTTDPLGNATTSTFDGLDGQTSLSSPMGETTSWQYDGSENLTSITDPLGNTTTYAHDDSNHPGDVTSVTDLDGRVKTLTYDQDGNVSSAAVSPATGVTDTTTYRYDADGEVVCQVGGNATAAGVTCPSVGGPHIAKTRTNTYDADGEVTATTDANGHSTSYVYDANENRTSTTDATGNVATVAYDGDNRVASSVTGADGATPSTTTNAYDVATGAAGCAATIAGATYCATKTDPNGHVTVDYFDARDQLLAETRSGGQTTSYQRDLNGNLTATIDAAGRTTSQQYDLDNRLTNTTYSDGTTPDVALAYDADGRRTSMTDGTGTTSYSYDADGRLTSTTDGSSATVAYAFDNSGNVTTLTYPNGQSVQRTYDGASRLSSVTDWLGKTTAYSYDADGNLTQSRLGNGDVTTSKFDDADQMSGISVATSSATVLAAIGYTRTANGSISQEADSGALTGTTNYSYDAKNELTAANTAAYGYDSAGNPTTVSGTGQQFNAADELTSTPTTSYGYDAVGDRTSATPISGPATTYTYDQAQRLTGVYQGSGFAPLTPARITDTRKSSRLPNAGKTLVPGGTLNVQVSGAGGVPAGATAAILNVTVTNTTGGGFLTVWPAGGARPNASSLNWAAGQTVPNLVEVPLNAQGQISLFSSSGTDVIVDVEGYDAAPTGPSIGLYNALTPSRICDTRASAPAQQCNGAGGGKFVGGTSRAISVAGQGGMPSTGATAVVLNVTVTNPTTGGYLTAWPDGRPRPNASNLNWTAGETVPNRVVVPIGADGKIALFTSSGTTDLIVDVAGYFAATGAVFTRVNPTRLCDTRNSGCGVAGASAGKVKAGGTLNLTVTGHSGVPAGATAVVLNVTVTNTTSGGYLTVYPDGKPRPRASDLNWTPGKTVPNLVVATVGAGGKVDFFNSTGNTDLIVDITGYYSRADTPATSYTYNGDGLRSTKANAHVGTTRFAWDVSSSVPILLTEAGTSYIYGAAGNSVQSIDGSNITYFSHDQQGSVRLLTDASGKTIGTYSFGVYGQAVTHTGATSAFQYGDQYTDLESGFLYLRARYYDPATALFVSVDPALSDSGAAYQYALNNPLNFADPQGLDPFLGLLGGVVGGIGGAVVGAGGYFVDTAVLRNKSFSAQGLAGSTVGGLVSGAIGGACIGLTDAVLLVGCSAAASGIGEATTEFLSGDSVSPSQIALATVLGGVTGGLPDPFPLVGRIPYKLRNVFRPGLNTLREYGNGLEKGGLAALSQSLVNFLC